MVIGLNNPPKITDDAEEVRGRMGCLSYHVDSHHRISVGVVEKVELLEGMLVVREASKQTSTCTKQIHFEMRDSGDWVAVIEPSLDESDEEEGTNGDFLLL